MNLKNLVIANATLTMTLKEITDLLNVRHDKAMLKVAAMAESPDFGQVSILDISYEKAGIQHPRQACPDLDSPDGHRSNEAQAGSRH